MKSALITLTAAGALLLGLCPAATATPAATAATATPAALATPRPLRIVSLSQRADLITGGEALVRIVVPAAVRRSSLRITDGRRDVSAVFAPRRGGVFEGLVTGIPLGHSVLTAAAPDGSGARLTITDHSRNGPLFSGPRLEPWHCRPGARDRECNHPTTYAYRYASVDRPWKLVPYDPAHPPHDVRRVHTDDGHVVPFIVRIETGTEDRDRYEIAVLYQPGHRWRPWAPQRGWNGNLEIPDGAGCGVHHGDITGLGDDFMPNVLDPEALAKGFATLGTALDNSSHDCNVTLQAESLAIAKEHFTDSYGPIGFTIGVGCSGGSLAQTQVANAYPGIYQGLIDECTFDDAVATMMDAEDCSLAGRYWSDPARWAAGVSWDPAQEAAAMGKRSPLVCQSWISAEPFSFLFDPRLENSGNDLQNCGITARQAFDPVRNPHGVRCTLQDAMVDVFGRRPDGDANRPFDNVGVQYGLRALEHGEITPAQFADLNARIGAPDIDDRWQPERVAADRPALTAAYRSGAVDEATHLAGVAVIDMPLGNDDIHEEYHAFALRARMRRAYGSDRNHVIWYGIGTALPNPLPAMDRWLRRVAADHRQRSVAVKVAADRPAGVHDICEIGDVVDPGAEARCARTARPGVSTRGGAGGPPTADVLKCRLVPLRRSAYGPIRFTAAEWAALRRAFGTGVCDWSRPGVGQQPTVAWQTYAHGPGGRPLGPPPASRPIAAQS